jgi:hypothetical protein
MEHRSAERKKAVDTDTADGTLCRAHEYPSRHPLSHSDRVPSPVSIAVPTPEKR